jgi:hypothetical protein
VTHRELVRRGDVHSEHIVHFFDDETARVQAVAAFLLEGLDQNHQVMVVTRPKIWAKITAALAGSNVDASGDARIHVFDPDQTLSGLMHRGHIDPERFRRTIVPLVKELAANAPAGLSAYGDMVDVLASEHNFVAAQELEVAWNQLAAETPLRLLCGYSSAHFASIQHRAAMLDLCAEHSHIRTDANDALGRWLVDGNGLMS